MTWNKITDGLPPIGVPLIVTVKDLITFKPNKLEYPVYYEKSIENNGYAFYWRRGDVCWQLYPETNEVVAWMFLPTPYEEEE